MHAVEVVKQQNLRVALAAIARLRSLAGLTDFDNDDVTGTLTFSDQSSTVDSSHLRHNVTLEFI